MNKDRLIQLVAIGIALVCLTGSMLLMPSITRQQRDTGFTYEVLTGDVPAKYALAAAAGTFRGLMVDAFWYRLEMFKREGKFNEANTLAEWITTLQPRFPQVWSFHAWNMAYNISVETHTPVERWDWVNKGIKLLREEGIPYNPTAVRLYRELGWIFFHKVGQFSDDMHWYYKRQMAEEWQQLLGAPTEGATTEEALQRFKPVADAADRYFVFNRLTLDVRKQLREMAETEPVIAEAILDLIDLNIVTIDQALRNVEQQLAVEDPALAERIKPIRALIDEQVSRSTMSALVLFHEDFPAATPVVKKIRDAGLEMDTETLRRFGNLIMIAPHSSPQALGNWLTEQGRTKDIEALRILSDPENRQGLFAILDYLRAQALIEDYNMDPGVMYELMELFGPLDWRHPAAHGVYWSFLGVRAAGELKDDSRIDLLNTDRQVIHGLQELMKAGRVSFDPVTGKLDLIPDPRFIPAYDAAMDRSATRMANSDFTSKEGTVKNFEQGHENFLLKAIVYEYLYGNTDQAQAYYDKLRDLYGDKAQNQRYGRYTLPLSSLVLEEFAEGADTRDQVRQFIDAMILQGITRGLARGQYNIFEQSLTLAKGLHDKYQDEKNYANAGAVQNRQQLLPFNEILANTYARYMEGPANPIYLRSRIYLNSPIQLREMTYPSFRGVVQRQAEADGIDMDVAFPPPPNFDEKAFEMQENRAETDAENTERQ